MKAEKIKQNYDKLFQIIEDTFSEEQSVKIKNLFKHFEDRVIETPASAKPNYHNCFPGGWLDHTLRVIKSSIKMREHFINLGVDVINPISDVVLAAMFHDLGKLGDLNNSYYQIQTDDWRRKKLNEFYTHNTEMENLSVTDRSLWLLQHFDIKIPTEVWKAIKMSDGMFDVSNERYFRTSSDSRNVLQYIVHLGDWSATIAEKQHYIQDSVEGDKPIVSNKIPKTSEEKKQIENMKSKFDELFN